MWWSDAVLPSWITRAFAFAAASGAGFVAALAALWLLLRLDVGDGLLFGAAIAHPAVVLAAALGCAAVVGVATVGGRSPSARRGLASAGVLLVLGLGAIGAFLAWSDRDFSADEFRAAAAAHDLEAMEFQARLAVESGALTGLSATEVRRTLGPPDRVSRRRHVYIWDLGTINDFIGPGDEGGLYVRFDSSWRRVQSARVG